MNQRTPLSLLVGGETDTIHIAKRNVPWRVCHPILRILPGTRDSKIWTGSTISDALCDS